MTVYNLTVSVDPAIEAEWIVWQQQVFIPGVMGTGLFREYRFYRLLETPAQEGGNTFVFQFTAAGPEQYERFRRDHAAGLLEGARATWGDRFVYFQTVMEAVQ
ncbi:MAG TPA: DUF4286 family protein [Chitinophagaceae bacterium]|nr:DUF4286 family protein [Chitinophagaceae bacterium]